jgi:ankyrin repeat protein
MFHDGAFPALPSSLAPQQGFSVWDDKPILVFSNALEPTPDEEAFIDNDDDSLSFSRLTPLRKTKHSKDLGPIVELEKEADCSSTEEEPLQPYTVPTRPQTKKIDIEKLRNRWWQVMKNKPPPETAGTESEKSEQANIILPAPLVVPVYMHSNVIHTDEEPLDSPYLKMDDPISEAVRQNDEDALRLLLKSSYVPAVDQESIDHQNQSPLQLAVDLERSNIVQILVAAARKGTTFLQDNLRFPPALLVAVERDYEEILQIILHSSFGTGPYFVNTRDSDGNNVLHACCRRSMSSSVLRLLITVPNAAGFVKLLSSTNHAGQNALHVVCEQNKAEFLDILLSSTSSLGGSFALLSKVLAMQDTYGQTPLLAAVASGSSDCVMSLLMWRGNNHQNLIPKKMDISTGGSPPCSLAWAVRAHDLDMVLLLLEFSDSGGSGYDLTGALQVAVLMRQQHRSSTSATGRTLLTILRVLVEAGANPCVFLEEPFPSWVREHIGCPWPASGLGRCALVLSVEMNDAEAIHVLLESYHSFLSRLNSKRRKDPVLAKQPDSFFAGLESKERSERTVALRASVITALVVLALDNESQEERLDATSSVLALYKGGAKLGLVGLRLLQACLKEKSLRALEDSSLVDSVPMSLRYRTTYCHPLGSELVRRTEPEELAFWNRVLVRQSWSSEFLQRDSKCSWIQSTKETKNNVTCNLPAADFIIISRDGHRFETHSRIICGKSEKLAAAFRFSQMSLSEDAEFKPIETTVSLGSQFLSLLLYHMYHGSLPTPTDSESAPINNETLLELLLIGEEFICPTLLQECELRFLFDSHSSHECFCPSCCLHRQSKNDHILCTIGGKGSMLTSHCNVSPDMALDALVLAQHIGSETYPQPYSLDVEIMLDDTVVQRKQLSCMEALRLVAASVILDHFPAVLLSEAFVSQQDGSPQALLEMCLDELSSLSNLSGHIRQRGSSLKH